MQEIIQPESKSSSNLQTIHLMVNVAMYDEIRTFNTQKTLIKKIYLKNSLYTTHYKYKCIYFYIVIVLI